MALDVWMRLVSCVDVTESGCCFFRQKFDGWGAFCSLWRLVLDNYWSRAIEMKLSLVRFGGGGDADVPAHIREKMKTSFYARHFNSFTTQGRANSVMAVVSGWVLFAFTMSKLAKSRKAKNPSVAVHPAATPAPRPSSQKKSGHH